MSRRGAGLLVLVALLALGAVAGARPWSSVDLDGLARAVDRASTVRLADLQAERARQAAIAAGAVVSGSVRTSAEAGWRAVDAGAAAPAGWDAGLGALAVTTQWYLVPAGPTHDAVVRAQRAHDLARQAALEARRDATIDALERLANLDRLHAQVAVAEARRALAGRARDAVASQAAAGTVSPAARAEAELSLAQAAGDLAGARADAAAALAAFERAFGLPASALWAPADAPLEGLLELAVPVAPLGPLLIDAAALEAASAANARVADATRALDDAVAAADRARRDAGLTVSLSARLVGSGDAGRWSVGAAWDSRSLQPSAEFSLDPWNPAAAQTTATLAANLSLPFGAATGATVAQAEIDAALALERWQQAWGAAGVDLETALRADEQASRAVALAIDRLALRATTLASVTARAGLGAASPLDLDRARLDALEAGLALLRADDQARSARTRLELALGRTPSLEPIAQALAATPSEVR